MLFHHLGVNVVVASRFACVIRRQRAILRTLPGPVQRVVLEAEKERVGMGASNVRNRTICEQIGQVSLLIGKRQVLVEIRTAAIIVVRKVIGRASVDPEKFIKAMTVRAEFGNVSEMPLPG